MDPISLIVAALVAGVAASATDVASDVIRDSYDALKVLLRRRFRTVSESAEEDNDVEGGGSQGAVDPEALLDAYESDPDTWERRIRNLLRATAADRDKDILSAAEALLEATGADAPRSSKYRVDARDAQGVQIGDHGTMTNSFGVVPTELPKHSS